MLDVDILIEEVPISPPVYATPIITMHAVIGTKDFTGTDTKALRVMRFTR